MRISDWSSDVCSSDLLLFLGSWRSTVIIVASIPLAILGAIIGLAATGQTLNVMTLSGLALAIGILVDDATVTIENINWHLENGRSEEHTSELQSLMRISYAVFCLKKKNNEIDR